MMASFTARDGGATPKKARNMAVAMKYFLLVISVRNPRLGQRNGRELKTWCTILDHLARKEFGQAADVAAQRVKAIEKSLLDGGWRRAQYAELIAPDGATLMDKDEEMMLAKEEEYDQRLQFGRWSNPNYPRQGEDEETGWEGYGRGRGAYGGGRWQPGRGKGYDWRGGGRWQPGKGRGKDGDKGAGRDRGRGRARGGGAGADAAAPADGGGPPLGPG